MGIKLLTDLQVLVACLFPLLVHGAWAFSTSHTDSSKQSE